MLGQLEGAGRVLIADLEPGVGNLTRMAPHSLDVVLVVVEPTPKSIEVAQRAAAIAAEREIGPVRFVANKVRDAGDLARLRAALAASLFVVPEDRSVLDADRDGVAVLDRSPDTAAVAAIRALASELAGG